MKGHNANWSAKKYISELVKCTFLYKFRMQALQASFNVHNRFNILSISFIIFFFFLLDWLIHKIHKRFETIVRFSTAHNTSELFGSLHYTSPPIVLMHLRFVSNSQHASIYSEFWFQGTNMVSVTSYNLKINMHTRVTEFNPYTSGKRVQMYIHSIECTRFF